MKIRVYVVKSSREVIIDTPVHLYQNENFDKCPHPWRFRETNPDKEEFSMRVVTQADLAALVGDTNEAGSAQFYIDEEGNLKHDNQWETLLMHPNLIKAKQLAKLKAKLDLEFNKDAPDKDIVNNLEFELKRVTKLADKGIYKLALANLQASNKTKPSIEAMLKAKIEETS